jgi:TRAP-type uncharacterized transport system substrate-binding protein
MRAPVHVKLLGGGQNWMPLCTRIALGLNGYYSPLPEGSTVSVSTREPGRNCFQAPALVAAGEYDMAITTPAWVGKLAAEGREPFPEPLPICSLACFAHDDRLAFAVRRETGLESIRDIKERKFPLKVSTPLRETRHPGVWGTEKVLAAYGFTLDDIESWGGKILRDRPRSQNVPGATPVSAGFDAIFDEAIMTRRWKAITEQYDIRFLPIEEDIIVSLAREGWSRAVISKGRFPGVFDDVPTVDFSGWYLFCRQDMDEELGYLTIKAIDEQKAAINAWFAEAGSGLTSPVDMRELVHGLPLPLHRGAEAYYREKGYL